MYTVRKKMEISASHSLQLSYDSDCTHLHGHNWRVAVYCRAAELNKDGMVVDFSLIKKNIQEKLDHQNLNDVLPFNTTAENIAKWICEQIPNCYKVRVRESENNTAWYEKDQ
jgi:6-pyruvoyltetrahydropterin/6-carboxytetrahydropterin synthase